jgi:WD40 repeat protein
VTAALLALEGLPDSASADYAQRSRPFVNEAWRALYGSRLEQRERVILSGHTSPVTRAVFAPDGGRILTASNDMTARLWEAFPDPQVLVDRVKAEVPRCLTRKQREDLFLAPEPPRWCIDMHKWPYGTPDSAKQQ